jgi:hypothetical protein
MLVFKHPKYYEEMRKRARAHQKELKASQEKKAISPNQSTDRGGRAPKKNSDKRQATSSKLRYTPTGILLGVDLSDKP